MAGGRAARRFAAAAAGWALALGWAAAAGAAEPVLVRGGEGGLRLAPLPAVLDRPAIEGQLASGLTTTFLVELREPGLLGSTVGAARVDVRYELWDEVYLVTAAGAGGVPRHLRFADRQALAAWWRRPDLVVAPSAAGMPGRLRLRLTVIPFSAAEQRDAQAWLTESLSDRPAGAAEQADDAAEEAGRPLDRLFRVLLATSISRGTLLEEEWEVLLPP